MNMDIQSVHVSTIDQKKCRFKDKYNYAIIKFSLSRIQF